MVVVEEDGARGSGVVRGDSEGLFKGLAVGRPFSGAVGSRRTASPVNRRFWCWVLSDEVHSIRRSVDGEGLNAPSDAGCFLTRGFAPPRKREYQS